LVAGLCGGFFNHHPKPHTLQGDTIMAIKLSANYSKKLGLPHYSSHSFSASVEIELADITQAEAEIQKLYQLLQHSVDQEIQNPGYIPEGNGSNGSNGNHNPPQNGRTYPISGNRGPYPNGNNGQRPQIKPQGEVWNCTEGQRGFILRILNENKLPMQEAEDLSRQLFGAGVKQLNKMQASQLIDDLLVRAGKPATRQTRWQASEPINHQAA
jgi:hypothetical protein